MPNSQLFDIILYPTLVDNNNISLFFALSALFVVILKKPSFV